MSHTHLNSFCYLVYVYLPSILCPFHNHFLSYYTEVALKHNNCCDDNDNPPRRLWLTQWLTATIFPPANLPPYISLFPSFAFHLSSLASRIFLVKWATWNGIGTPFSWTQQLWNLCILLPWLHNLQDVPNLNKPIFSARRSPRSGGSTVPWSTKNSRALKRSWSPLERFWLRPL